MDEEAAEAAKMVVPVGKAGDSSNARAGDYTDEFGGRSWCWRFQELTVLAEECWRVVCRSLNPAPPIPIKDTGSHLYRIAQEAVNNSLKHAQASRIDIRLFTRGPQVVLMITDDGIGIRADVGEQGRGMGLG